jgi:hypothetical protein
MSSNENNQWRSQRRQHQAGSNINENNGENNEIMK